MKKILLFVFVSILSISAFAAADLNPFAYKLSEPVYDASANSVTISYHLNAPATKVRIVIYQDEASPVTYQDFTGSSYTSAGAHTAKVSLQGVPGGYYTYKIDVYGRGQASTVAFHKRTILNSPFGIDIDNNMNSPWFGRTLVTQPTTKNNTLRGLFEYWPSYFTLGTTPANPYNGGVNNYYQGTQSWFYYSHATPLRVRIAQDGSGRIFTTACDVDMDTYLWYVDPSNPNNWTSLITASQMTNIVNHPNTSKIHNISLDIRTENDKLNLLLLSGTIEYGYNKNFTTGYIYSGKYVLPANFPTSTAGDYIHVIDPNMKDGFIGPHSYIKSGLLPVAISSSSQFDKYGGYWYCGTSQATDKDPYDGKVYKDKTGIKHVTTNGDIKFTYHNADEKLKRYWTGTGGFRYNHDFSQVLIANGYNKTARLYNVTQTSAATHPSLTFVTELGTIFADASNYITDFAWDHANNIYVVLRNGSSGYGIYTYATQYNAADPFTTKAPNGVTFEVKCYDNVTYTLTTSVNDANMGTISAGGSIKSCTEVTVTATPKEGYRFVNWTINGVEVNGANPYTLYMTDNMDVRANFAPAVYNVTWWNLFQNGEDIAKESSTTPNSNERLWRLYQVFFNQYCVNKSVSTRKDKAWVGDDNTERLKYKEFDAAGYFTNRNDANANYLKATIALRSNDKTDENTPFVWLRKYIEYINNGVEINAANSYATLGNRCGYALYCFFNRTNTARNTSASDATYMIGLQSNHKSFATYGQSSEWRPWWTEEACDLPRTYNYSTPMPISWRKIDVKCNDYSITSDAARPNSYKIEDVPINSWYKWNTGKPNQLLAWREGDSITGPIVHQVDHDMALYATYLNKHISESQDNYDVIRLMQNSNYASNPHTVAVDRKLQAGMYNTICFPFPLNVTTLPSGHRLKDAEVLKFTGIEELYDESGEVVGVLQFESVTQLEAGKPYLIKVNGQDNITEKMYFEKVAHNNLTYVGDTLSAGEGLITFHGIISPKDIPEGSIILVSDNRLAKVTTQGQMLGLRGYFTIDDPYVQSLVDEGKLYLSIKKPTTTSIPVAPEAEQQKAPKVRKIMQDGHIYIIRGEEVYTVTGHRVK